jgi:hypothetical protein
MFQEIQYVKRLFLNIVMLIDNDLHFLMKYKMYKYQAEIEVMVTMNQFHHYVNVFLMYQVPLIFVLMYLYVIEE